MTPRPIEWRSVNAKLRELSNLLDELDAMGPVDIDRLHGDRVTELAIERILTLLVELSFSCNSHVATRILRRIPDSYAESFDLAARAGMISSELAGRLRPSAKMRDVLVHAYLEVDREQVAAAVPLAIAQYREYVRQVAAFAVERAT